MINDSLFIIDAMALAHRCYHLFKKYESEAPHSAGMVTNAKSFIENIVNTWHPTYMVVANDAEGTTFRHNLYPEYKANRSPKEEGFVQQLPVFFRLFEEIGIPVIEKEGYEADDIVGSLTTKFASPELKCWIVSADKDFMQLVNDNVVLLRPIKYPEFEVVNKEGVLKKTDLLPEQIVDYLAITGDSADNIPGAKGIGPKGAAKLLKSFHTLESINENVDLIPQKGIREKLNKSVMSMAISQALATIQTEIPLEVAISDLKFDPSMLESQKVKDFFESLGVNN